MRSFPHLRKGLYYFIIIFAKITLCNIANVKQLNYGGEKIHKLPKTIRTLNKCNINMLWLYNIHMRPGSNLAYYRNFLKIFGRNSVFIKRIL